MFVEPIVPMRPSPGGAAWSQPRLQWRNMPPLRGCRAVMIFASTNRPSLTGLEEQGASCPKPDVRPNGVREQIAPAAHVRMKSAWGALPIGQTCEHFRRFVHSHRFWSAKAAAIWILQD